MMKRSAAIPLAFCILHLSFCISLASAQQTPSPASEPLHRPFDQALDLYVRDGLVYYRALRSDRARLDRYIAALGNTTKAAYDAWPREQKMAFWVNAYNAFVLQTVIQNYPLRGNSIRNVPGAFDQRQHRAGGRTVTLDQIEKKILPEFRDPRLYLALGRGANGSGRLRSEVYTGSRMEEQLKSQTDEFLGRQDHLKIDRLGNQIEISPIIGWHEGEFIAAYARGEESSRFANRSPLERAVLALIDPILLPAEREFVGKGQFKIVYQQFDWTLNELK